MSNNKTVTRTILYSAAGLVLLAAASINTAIAQETGATALEEVIVTARKREESLQDSPVVISALSKETIDDFAITSIEDIADFTPGLIADSQGNSG